MSRTKIASAFLSAAALASVLTPVALGEAAPGSNGCKGNTVALFNHNSVGASGNPNASAGPGYFLASGGPGAVAAAVHDAQSVGC